MREQLNSYIVLPRKLCYKLAHVIPAGHLGRKKTAQRILQKCYWPNVFKNAAEFCTTCQLCQKTAPGKKIVAPLIFPQNHGSCWTISLSYNRNKYALVISDYATRYPKAIQLWSIDTEHIADELIKVFSRVGVPREILTGQGSNFTSQLLSKVY